MTPLLSKDATHDEFFIKWLEVRRGWDAPRINRLGVFLLTRPEWVKRLLMFAYSSEREG